MKERGPVEIFYIYKLDNKEIKIIFSWYNVNINKTDRTIKAA
jgi:hypothetical protein